MKISVKNLRRLIQESQEPPTVSELFSSALEIGLSDLIDDDTLYSNILEIAFGSTQGEQVSQFSKHEVDQISENVINYVFERSDFRQRIKSIVKNAVFNFKDEL